MGEGKADILTGGKGGKAGPRRGGSESLTNIEVVLGLPTVLQVVDERVADLTLQIDS